MPDFEPDRDTTTTNGSGSAPGGHTSHLNHPNFSSSGNSTVAAAAIGGVSGPLSAGEQQRVSEAAAQLSALVSASGKLQLLDRLLVRLHGQNQRVLVLSHSAKASTGGWGVVQGCWLWVQ